MKAINRPGRPSRAALLLLTAALVAGGLLALLNRPETTSAGDANNIAVAVNTKDGKSVYRVRIAIRRENGDVVSSTNAAIAYSSCTDCQTTAIAFEVLLITNTASVVSPTNLAIAVNENCSGCQTIAEAYQFIHSTDGKVHFTHDGSKRLADVRHELHALRKSDVTPDELQARLDALATEIADVLAHDLVIAGQ
jgi:putative peptide zinc metalloprotease protein